MPGLGNIDLAFSQGELLPGATPNIAGSSGFRYSASTPTPGYRFGAPAPFPLGVVCSNPDLAIAEANYDYAQMNANFDNILPNAIAAGTAEQLVLGPDTAPEAFVNGFIDGAEYTAATAGAWGLYGFMFSGLAYGSENGWW